VLWGSLIFANKALAYFELTSLSFYGMGKLQPFPQTDLARTNTLAYLGGVEEEKSFSMFNIS
jgi:hypothetical protein